MYLITHNTIMIIAILCQRWAIFSSCKDFCAIILVYQRKKNKNVANFDIEGTVSLPDACTLKLNAYLLLLLASFVFIIIYRECPYFLEIILSS